MAVIKLTQGQQTLVDDVDYVYLSKENWSAYRISGTSHTGKVYTYGFKAGRKEKGKKIWIHNVIMNPKNGEEVDHINGNPLDNRRENLRVATHKQNTFNKGKQNGSTSSKYVGVYFKKDAGRYRAYIHDNNKEKHLGYFDNEVDAAKAYNVEAIKLFGVYAKLNDV